MTEATWVGAMDIHSYGMERSNQVSLCWERKAFNVEWVAIILDCLFLEESVRDGDG